MARPTKYQAEYCDQARKLALLGATDKQVADFFDVTEQTVNNWKKDYPEFFESLKLGKEEIDNRVVESLYRRATGYSHPEEKVFNNGGEIVTHQTIKHYPPDSTSLIFWLKNRRPEDWRDKQEHEHSGKDGGPIEIDNVDDIEIARRVAFLLMSGQEHAPH